MVAALRLRWTDAFDEDLIPSIISWIIAWALGAGWLLIVYLAPAAPAAPPVAAPPAEGGVPVDYMPKVAVKSAGAPTVASRDDKETSRAPTPSISSRLAIAKAFAEVGVGRVVGEITQLIPGVTAVQGEVGAPSAGVKASVSAREGDTRLGLSQFGSGTAGPAGLGVVHEGASIKHTEMHVQPLPLVTAPALGGTMADATEMGTFVRARVAQLQSCYERSGGSDVAGVVALRLTIGDAGAVRSAEIVRRTWSGPGAAATEQCLLDLVRGWRIPSGSAGATVTIPISFTRGT